MSTQAPLTANRTWKFDSSHSTVAFAVPYIVGKFRGSFRDVDASLTTIDDLARLAGTAAVSSIDVKDAHLAGHLQSPDFFDAEQYPELRLVAADLDLAGGAIEAPAQLTIKGVTRDVVLTGDEPTTGIDPYGNHRIGLTLATTIDRTDYGVSWNAPLPNGKQALANEVTLSAELFFVAGE